MDVITMFPFYSALRDKESLSQFQSVLVIESLISASPNVFSAIH